MFRKNLLAIIVILLCIGIIIFMNIRNNEIKEVFEAIEKRDVNTLAEHSSFISKNEYGKQQRYERMKKIDQSMGISKVNVSHIRLESEKLDVRTYSALIKYDSEFGSFEKKGYYKFEKNDQNNKWELNWSPEVIIPGLTANNEIRVETVKSQRGKIVDRNNVPLAIDGKQFQVGVDTKSYDSSNNMEVSQLLNIKEENVKNLLKQSWIKDGIFVPLKKMKEISPALRGAADKYHLIINETSGRTYPLDEAAAHLIGYVGNINADELKTKQFKDYDKNAIVGKIGLEKKYDRQLQNKDGLIVYITKDDYINDEQEVLIYDKPQNGKTIKLTIDSRVQRSIYENLKDDYGSGTAMDQHTGGMLALVSYPSFSPYDFMFGISNKDYKKLTGDKKEPLLNKFQITSSPGSTQKILTSIIGLNNGTLNEQKTYHIEGKGWQKNNSWGGYQMTRFQVINGDIDLNQAITSSDNIFFGRTAIDMGGEKFIEGMKAFGIGEDIPSDYPFYTGQIANKDNLEKHLNNEILLGDSGYGQGEIQIAPAQILSIYSALINDGNMMVPKVNMKTKSKVWKTKITSPKNMDLLKSGMRKVVSVTEKNYAERPYAKFAGKTGTAELKMSQNEGLGTQIGWFIGYDMNNPNMMLAINIKNVEQKGMSTYNAQKFAAVMDDLYMEGQIKYDPNVK